MFQDNPLLAQLKQQIQENIPKKEGTVKATDRGFGFLESDDKKKSIFIPPAQMKKVMHGDKVVALIRTENDKEQAEPDQLIEQSITRFIGRIQMFKKRLQVMPDHPSLKNAIKAKARKGVNPETLKEGDWVVAELTQHPLKGDQSFLCEVTHKITDSDDKIAPWWVTLAQNDLPNSEPEGIENWEIKDDADLVRLDMTETPFVTIDGESTKDMDDALYIKKQADGSFELTIAIADPTAYITPDDSMDKVARKRGYTIYLPGRNIPMLPRDLSDQLCSLIENKDRPAICCTVHVDADGTINEESINFFAATIKSHARLAYDNVSDFLETGSCDKWQPTEVISQVVTELHEFAQARTTWRQTHADMRRTANKLVEEAMVTANICAGKTLRNTFNMGVFNSHAGIKSDKLKDVIEIVNQLDDVAFTEEHIATLEGFSELRRLLGNQPTSYLDARIRKYQTYSETGNEPLPHYAMGLDIYATWTSPIRKYSDMINHRMLKAHILGKEPVQRPDDIVGEELALSRRYHRMAERNVSDWLYCRTLASEVEKGTEFTAEIFDINRAGMRVRLIENGAAAFIPGSLIVDNKERIECNADQGTISIDKHETFKLGDQLQVTLAEVKEDTRNMVAKPLQAFPALEMEDTVESTDA
ncbi:exoribonuclease II [Aliivibrio finisterrensis]|uniref:exoribonuclease II n=1 Tax=Aliivibrio finisterrensis TaxID=511998 RepID=UPI00101F41BD|nr:exoribonuclease II [Aliivibrio finisterrensis]RYU74158.1 exoribonuclease II [Aliivibrio finisterrensis]